MMLDIPGAIESLQDMADRMPGDVDWANENPLAVDAVRGSLHELKWRKTLGEYFRTAEYESKWSVIDSALIRLIKLEYDPWVIPPWDIGKIGLGTYGWKYDLRIIQRALSPYPVGIIDTAETYGYGKVEEVLGLAFEDEEDLPIIATKVSRSHMSYQSVLNAAHRSLKRLKVSVLDLYQVHWPNPKVPMSETMIAIKDLICDDEVFDVGVCNFAVDQIIAAQQELSPHAIATVQVRYNLQDRGVERLLLPWCREVGIAVIAYSPLGQNFRKFKANDKDGVLDALASEYGVSAAQIALAWVIHKGAVPIPRTNNVDHVDEIAEAGILSLDRGDVELLDHTFPIQE